MKINPQQLLCQLEQTCAEHPIWQHSLFIACDNGTLTIEDFRVFFSQYYYYNKNFSRLLAAIMANCDSDFYRSKLTQNLWEESGEKDIENRHAEIFRKFLISSLQINPECIQFEVYSKQFGDNYLQFCLDNPITESSAALSLGTEGIVSKMYGILRSGLLKAGLQTTELQFFDIHIACDDEHAETIKEIMLSYSHEKNWFNRCKQAMCAVLDLRYEFFNMVYEQIKMRRFNALINHITYKSEKMISPTSVAYNTSFNENILYVNEDKDTQLSFQVHRLPFFTDVLDPRLVTIPCGCHNEYHQHAHETVLLILHGDGEVIIEDQVIVVKANDIVHVPRWLQHQTQNKGKGDLQFFAVTDYGLTKRVPSNSESSYRLNKRNALT
ncbi:MAG: iron-containing redox enzyme family protein [Burkholderiales bacterium]|nr:iron-containing redox enzyme family protein [Burkholderiales bacterium]